MEKVALGLLDTFHALWLLDIISKSLRNVAMILSKKIDYAAIFLSPKSDYATIFLSPKSD